MKTDVIITMTMEEFMEAISSAVRVELKKHLPEELENDELMKVHHVQKLLHVSKPTVYSYVHKGLITAYKIEGRTFFLRSEILKLLKSDNNETSRS